jgi:predicted transcriptional regulator
MRISETVYYDQGQFSRYRTKIQYFAEILNATLDGEQKTRIMFRVYTSYKQLKHVLKDLQCVELLIYDNYRKIYHTTHKGRRLELYRELSRGGMYV